MWHGRSHTQQPALSHGAKPERTYESNRQSGIDDFQFLRGVKNGVYEFRRGVCKNHENHQEEHREKQQNAYGPSDCARSAVTARSDDAFFIRFICNALGLVTGVSHPSDVGTLNSIGILSSVVALSSIVTLSGRLFRIAIRFAGWLPCGSECFSGFGRIYDRIRFNPFSRTGFRFPAVSRAGLRITLRFNG